MTARRPPELWEQGSLRARSRPRADDNADRRSRSSSSSHRTPAEMRSRWAQRTAPPVTGVANRPGMNRNDVASTHTGDPVRPVLDRCDVPPRIIFVSGPNDEYEPWLAAQSPLEARYECEERFLQLYTARTTGSPKGAMLTHQGLIAHPVSTATEFGINEAGVIQAVMPLRRGRRSVDPDQAGAEGLLAQSWSDGAVAR